MFKPNLKNDHIVHDALVDCSNCPLQHYPQSHEVMHRINTAYVNKEKRLDLRNLRITTLPNLADFYWIEELDLSNNKLTDISNLPQFENLKVLNVSGNKIKDLMPLSYYFLKGDMRRLSYDATKKPKCKNGEDEISCCANSASPRKVCKYSTQYQDYLFNHGIVCTPELLDQIRWSFISTEVLRWMSAKESMENLKITVDEVRMIKGNLGEMQEEAHLTVEEWRVNLADKLFKMEEEKSKKAVKEQSRCLANKVMTGEGIVLQRITLSKEAFEENNVRYSYISKEKKFLSFVSQEESQEGECSIDTWETFKSIDNCKEATVRFDPSEKFTKSFYKKFPSAKNNLFLSYLFNEFPDISLEEEANNLLDSTFQIFKDRCYLKKLQQIVYQKGTFDERTILKAVIQLIYRLTVEKGYDLEHIMRLAYNPKMFTDLHNLSLYSIRNGCAAKILEVNPLKDEALVRCVIFPNVKRTKNSIILGQPYEHTVTCPINQLF